MKHFKLRQAIPVALILGLLLIPAIAQAQSIDILKIYNEYSKLSNPDELIKYFTDDAVFQDPGGPVQGKVAILAKLKEAAAMTGPSSGSPTTIKYSVEPRVEGNKVIARRIVEVPGRNVTLEVDFTVEFQGDKIKKTLIVPTPESLQKLAASQGQGGAPGVPSTGAGGAAATKEDDTLLLVALIASGMLIISAAGVALMMNRRTIRR